MNLNGYTGFILMVWAIILAMFEHNDTATTKSDGARDKGSKKFDM